MSISLKPIVVAITVCTLLISGVANAVTTTFFQSAQVASLVESGATFDTISSDGYLFTYTRDKLFTGGVGMTVPIGRAVRVPWPDGVEAQAVTIAPYQKAEISISRLDGNPFDLSAFSAKLLANTAGAGGDFEVVPMLAGEDLYGDPVMLFASAYYGNTFSYSTSPNPGPFNPYSQTTLSLTGADVYKISLYVDFALTGLTLIDSSAPEPPPAIPEPETYAMMLAGLGLVGLMVHRRKTLAV